jgi:serine phosphatase RsbU (regulator of sigma subunit)
MVPLMDDSYADPGLRLFESMLARTHTSTPSTVGDVIAEELERALDARAVVIYLVNLEQTALVPVPRDGHPEDEPQDVEGSMVGRSYTATKILTGPGAETGRLRFFVPIVDGTDRLGTIRAELPVEEPDRVPEDLVRLLERYGHASAQVLVAKRVYGDTLHRIERTRPMDLGAELLASVLPPPTFATDGLVISAMVQPAYENGGDAYDYAVNDASIHLAVFDAVGHGLHAARLSTFAVASYRNCRRAGLDLTETYGVMDAALAEQFGRDVFTTGVLAELDPHAGVVRWMNAGHPAPLLLRRNRVVKALETTRATPFGMPMFGTEPTIGEERLQPEDILVLYTDGLTEARQRGGAQLGVEGLSEFLQREAAAQLPPPETLRRLRRAVASDGGPILRDDATVLVAHWHRGAERTLLPQTV